MAKELKIRDFCGDYALDIPNFNGETITLFFNSRRNAENVKRIIEVDGSVPNHATVCDMQEVRHGEWIKSKNERKCSICGYFYFTNTKSFNYCPNCGATMNKDKE